LLPENWIFVTGAIRSGTTFLGTVLSYPRETDYIHEPFNPQCGMPGIEFGHRYIRPTSEAIACHPYHSLAESIFSYDLTLRTYNPKSDPFSRRLLKVLVGSRGPFNLKLAKLNIFRKSAVLKDPHAVLLTEYLANTFDVKPVLIVKHPLSFLASLKRVNWWPSPIEIADQQDLIEDHFKLEQSFLCQDWSTPLLRSAAFWRCIHKVLLNQLGRHPEWILITHEALSREPVVHFKHLYKTLSLPWSSDIENKVVSLTQGNKSARARSGRVQDFKRNSADIFRVNRESLSIEERRAVFEIVQDVALQLYSRESFAID
jgi:hypothetical protein